MITSSKGLYNTGQDFHDADVCGVMSPLLFVVCSCFVCSLSAKVTVNMSISLGFISVRFSVSFFFLSFFLPLFFSYSCMWGGVSFSSFQHEHDFDIILTGKRGMFSRGLICLTPKCQSSAPTIYFFPLI